MKIICFGDSITRGVTYMKGRLRIIKQNYPTILQDWFGQKEGPPIEVVNKGVFNDNSAHLLERLEKDVLAEHPAIVLIGIGGNDCNFKWAEVAEFPRGDHTPTVPLDSYIENIKTIISKVKEEGITPILLAMPPLDPVRYYEYTAHLFSSKISEWICRTGGIEHWHGMYNRALKKTAKELGVKFIDIRTAMKKAGELKVLISDDGIHPTEAGYQAIASEIYHSLLSILKKEEDAAKPYSLS
ncbi:SGNH/GDSL hydrolase family protein [Gracilibacillus sp. Marseille-QA3620]